jgi:hypothetical protein
VRNERRLPRHRGAPDANHQSPLILVEEKWVLNERARIEEARLIRRAWHAALGLDVTFTHYDAKWLRAMGYDIPRGEAA